MRQKTEKPMEEDKSRETVAVFFDSENVSPKNIPATLKKIMSFGNISILRAYADWSLPSAKPWKELLFKEPITPIQQFHNEEKQAVDKAIMMDAILVAAEHPDIQIFCLITSDKGFATLALKLREMGRRVIGFGEKSKAKEDSLLVNACNEYHYFEDLKSLVKEVIPTEEKNSDMQAFSLSKFLGQAVDATPKNKDGYALLSQVGESLFAFKPDFNYRDYGYTSLRHLIGDFPAEYELFTDEKTPPTYFVSKKEFDGSETLEGTVKRIINSYGIIENKPFGDFFFYRGDILRHQQENKIKKGMRVRFMAVKMPDESASNSLDRNGRAEQIEFLESDEETEE